jgi:hypothetical protein
VVVSGVSALGVFTILPLPPSSTSQRQPDPKLRQTSLNEVGP